MVAVALKAGSLARDGRVTRNAQRRARPRAQARSIRFRWYPGRVDPTLLLAVYGASLATANAGVQAWDKRSAHRVDVVVSILEAWEEHPDMTVRFVPDVLVRNRGRSKTWIAVIGVEVEGDDNGMYGIDDRQERRMRALEPGQSLTFSVPAGDFRTGDVLTAYAQFSFDDWAGRAQSVPLRATRPPSMP